MTRNRFRHAGAAVSALALATLAMGASYAFADDTPPTGGTPAANVALINGSATNTLHITKYAGAPTGQINNGTPIGGASAGTPLAGVTYDIYKVPNVDLTTNAGWTSAASYYNNIAAAQTAVGTAAPVGTCTTNATGQCDIAGLPVALYYVVETSAPASYTKAAPFLVTLPMTNPNGPDGVLGTADDNTSWMYDVYVYPKNQQDTITKAVTDKGTQTTDNSTGAAASHVIDYTLTSSITDGTDPLGMYVIYDDLDPSLTFTGATLNVGSTALIAGTDYTVTTAPDWTTPATAFTGTAVAGGPVVTITFTDSGLTKLQSNRSSNVTTVLHTTVGAEDADGVVPNTASFIPNQGWWNQHTTPPGTPPGIPSNQVVTKYGDVKINKFDGGAPSTKLAGAEFMVYKDANADGVCQAAEMVGANVIGGPVVTDATGTATYKGLQTSDFYNNATQTTLLTYCMVETKAPTGYNLNAQPIPFTVMQTTDGTLALTTLDVANEKSNLGNSLPLTGGQGVAALSIGGLVLIGGGAGYYLLAARRRRVR